MTVNQMVGEVLRRSCGRCHGFLRVGIDLVHEALAAHVDIKAYACVDHEIRIRMRLLNDRAAVKLIHVNEFGAERSREKNVFSRHIGGSAEDEPGKRTAHVAAEHFPTAGKAARRYENAVPGIEILPPVIRNRPDA